MKVGHLHLTRAYYQHHPRAAKRLGYQTNIHNDDMIHNLVTSFKYSEVPLRACARANRGRADPNTKRHACAGGSSTIMISPQQSAQDLVRVPLSHTAYIYSPATPGSQDLNANRPLRHLSTLSFALQLLKLKLPFVCYR
jgi:hypothetical protein